LKIQCCLSIRSKGLRRPPSESVYDHIRGSGCLLTGALFFPLEGKAQLIEKVSREERTFRQLKPMFALPCADRLFGKAKAAYSAIALRPFAEIVARGQRIHLVKA